jgi:methionyl-tRNA synthetase
MDRKPLYLTTTLPYVNAPAHLGHVVEFIRADVAARFHRAQGRDVFFNTGTDEHGVKILQKAREAGQEPQAFADELSATFRDLRGTLDLTWDAFTRTTDASHKEAAQEFWRRVEANGYIYKKAYRGLYCVGCEMFVTEKDLLPDGSCPNHPGKVPEEIEEENYFFAFSKFARALGDLIDSRRDFIVPEERAREARGLIAQGLEDFSISRLAAKMPWGVPVPGDDAHVMYVWFDALVSYISCLGWPADQAKFGRYWGEGEPTQYCGKDNLGHQALRWQAMLLAAGLPTSRRVVVDGFITSGGQKMSKTVGNVVDPLSLVASHGSDALRFFAVRELAPFEDSDFTPERYAESYRSGLQNGFGNLASRILTLSEKHLPEGSELADTDLPEAYVAAFHAWNLKAAADFAWEQIGALDRRIQETEPFKLVKSDPERAKVLLGELRQSLYEIARMAEPIVPRGAAKVLEAVRANKKPEPIYPRVEA